MADLPLEILEKLVFSEDKRSVLKELTPHTEQALFVELLVDLHEGKQGAEVEKKVKEFIDSSRFSSEKIKKIWMMNFFNRLEKTEDKSALFKELIKQLKLEYNFMKPERVQIARDDLIADAKTNLSSEIKKPQEAQITLAGTLEKLYAEKDSNFLNELNNEAVRQIDLSKFLSTTDSYILSQIFNKATNLAEMKGAEDAFIALLKQKYENTDWFNKFTLEQQERLLKSDDVLHTKSYFEAYMRKRFHTKNEVPYLDKVKTFEEKADFLKQKIEFLSKVPKKYEFLFSQALLELLNHNMKRDIYDEALFLKYLKVPTSQTGMYNQNYRQQLSQYIQTNKMESFNLPTECNPNNAFFEAYLNELLKTDADIKKYVEFFDSVYLTNIFTKAQLQRGKDVPNAYQILQESGLKALNDLCVLDIKNNPEQFKKGDKVALKAKLKNIKELKVRIFEINVLNYLLERNNLNFETISLSGLIPIQENLYTYTQRPIESHVETFELANLQTKSRGVYIIEFVGNEQYAKAVIRIGGLKLLYDKFLGRRCVILDEDCNVCKGEKTGLYIKGKFFSALPEGPIMIPENIECINTQVVVSHDGFADLCRLETFNNQYDLQTDFFFNPEEFVAGNQVCVYMAAVLKNRGSATTIQRLKNPEIEVKTTNESGVENQIPIKGVELSDSKDFAINFLMPPKIVDVRITLRGTVLIEKDETKIEKSSNFAISRTTGGILNQFFLKRDASKEYTLYVLGLNGEDKKSSNVRINFYTRFKSSPIQFDFTSDTFGKIYLHSLRDVKKIEVTSDEGASASFAINSEDYFNYQTEAVVTEGEKLVYSKKKSDEVSIFEIAQSASLLNNMSKLLTISDSSVEVKFEKEGAYLLQIGTQSIHIVCLKGTKLEIESSFIKTDNAIFLDENTYAELGVALTQKDDIVEGKISSTKGKHIRAYLVTNNFLPKDTTHASLKRQFARDLQVFTSNPIVNKYTNQASLGDELIYVVERKARKNYMGNTLDKPGILLKRQKVSDTQEGEQTVRPPEIATAAATRMADQRQGRGVEYFSAPVYLIDEKPFIGKPGDITPLKIDGDKFTLSKADVDAYSYSYVLLHDGSRSVIVPISETDKPLEKFNRTLRESKKEGFVYIYDRKANYLGTANSKTFKNIQNTEISIVNNVSNLWDTILLIGSNTSEAAEWKFLANWDALSPMEKLKKYDKYCSNELNLFLFFKDAEFFKEVTLPFISNKKEKKIIDLFLLGDAKALERFCDISNFNNFTLLELVFLCLGVRESNPKFSAAIRSFFKSKAAINKIPVDTHKRIFDSILSSKISKMEQPTLEGAVAPPPPPSGGFGGAPPSLAFAPSAAPVSFAAFSNIAPQRMAHMTQYAAPMARMAPRGMVSLMGFESSNRMRNVKENAFLGREMDENEICEEFAAPPIQVYSAQQGTTEYKERTFFFQSSGTESYEEFWVDFCEHYCKFNTIKNFFSPAYIHAATSSSKAVVILSVVDLSYKSDLPVYEKKDNELKITASNPIIIFSKEIIDEKAEKLDLDVLIAQRFYDPQDQFIIDEESEGARIEKPISEFIIGKVYGSRVVVTNSTTIELNLSLIYEIPQGSIPIDDSDQMKLSTISIKPFESSVKDFKFYFPQAGQFSIYPATIIKGSKIIASANIAKTFDVKESLTVKKTDTIVDILSTGSIDDIIEFVRTKNILNTNIFQFDQIYWLLKNKDFYSKLIDVLRERGVYDNCVWSFSLYHGDAAAFKEYIGTIKKGQLDCFKYFVNSFVNICEFDFREYYPLINPRAHALGGKKQNILNQSFKTTYSNYLMYLVDKWTIDTEDKIALCDYLLLQDRMEEASALFASITAEDVKKSNTKLQHDYLAAYIDFLNGYPNFSIAKSIAEKYLVYPILSWRNLFVEIANQLAEFEEKEVTAKIDSDKAESNQKKAQKSANFKCEIDKESIKIESEKIKSFTIKFYKIDLEVIFSQNPFRNSTDSAFTFVQPFQEKVLPVDYKEGPCLTVLSIPQNLTKESLFIEINHNEEGATKSKFLEYSPFVLSHSINQEFGIIKVFDPSEKKPIPKIYVKCFAKYKNGSVAFYKDGYTDIRGSFDYAALSKDKIDDVQIFSILILSPEYGSKIVQVDPPVKIGKVEGEARMLANKEFQEKREVYKGKMQSKYAAVY